MPVIQFEAADARNAAGPTISSGSTIRFIAIFDTSQSPKEVSSSPAPNAVRNPCRGDTVDIDVIGSELERELTCQINDRPL